MTIIAFISVKVRGSSVDAELRLVGALDDEVVDEVGALFHFARKVSYLKQLLAVSIQTFTKPNKLQDFLRRTWAQSWVSKLYTTANLPLTSTTLASVSP